MKKATLYSINSPAKFISGPDSINNIADLAVMYGAGRALVITDQGVSKAGLVKKPVQLLEDKGIVVKVIDNVPAEPEIGQVKALFERACDIDCEIMIAIGGGSVMDVTKLLAVMKTNKEFAEKIPDPSAIKVRGITTIMVPTTAGTGSEVTPNAIVTLPDQELKFGIVNELMIPDCVLLDPCLTIGLPAHITASTGVDAFVHALECYISNKANPFSDTYALRAIRLISRSIRKAYNEGTDIDARHDMLVGAMYGGMAINASGTAAVHALAYPLGGKYRIPHGVSNAMLLSPVMEFNFSVVEKKFAEIASEMGIDVCGMTETDRAKAVLESIKSMVKDLNIPTDLKKYGVSDSDLELLVEAASKVTRLLSNNPKELSKDDMRSIYKKLL